MGNVTNILTYPNPSLLKNISFLLFMEDIEMSATIENESSSNQKVTVDKYGPVETDLEITVDKQAHTHTHTHKHTHTTVTFPTLDTTVTAQHKHGNCCVSTLPNERQIIGLPSHQRPGQSIEGQEHMTQNGEAPVTSISLSARRSSPKPIIPPPTRGSFTHPLMHHIPAQTHTHPHTYLQTVINYPFHVRSKCTKVIRYALRRFVHSICLGQRITCHAHVLACKDASNTW